MQIFRFKCKFGSKSRRYQFFKRKIDNGLDLHVGEYNKYIIHGNPNITKSNIRKIKSKGKKYLKKTPILIKIINLLKYNLRENDRYSPAYINDKTLDTEIQFSYPKKLFAKNESYCEQNIYFNVQDHEISKKYL